MTSLAGEAAGPGFDTSLTGGFTQVGPGFNAPSFGKPSDYYNKPLPAPIVQTTEKYTYDQLAADIHALQQRYGSHMRVEVIGRTADGRDLYDVVVGNPDARKHVMIQSGIHAREYITSLLVMKQLDSLLAFYDSGTFNDQPVSNLMDQVAVHFIPMANPDGVSISQFGEGGVGSEALKQVLRDSYAADLADQRTSLSYDQYLTTWKSNARGVDLNHNFDVGWASLNGAMTHTSATDYKGAAPLSEQESAAIASLIDRYPFQTVLNYHAMGQVIYWDTADNRQKGNSLQLAQNIASSNGYQIINSLGRGGVKDWVQSKSNAIPSVTVEVGKTACPVPISEFETIWEQNKNGVMQAVDFAVKH